jgi:two-component system chemotaxis response regulator CheY
VEAGSARHSCHVEIDAMPFTSFENLKICLVEPSAMQAQVVLNMLRQLGVQRIRHAGNAKEALTEMTREQPDVVISALYLPDMPGTDLVGAMRENETLEWTPFILISSETRPRVLDPVRQSGACCIIAKPFALEQLKRALDTVLEMLTDPEELGEGVEDLKVLLVDDSAMSRHYVRHLLESMGVKALHIVEAENGKAAMVALADTMFDIVLTDYNMPEMDGRALIEYIRTQSWQTEIPILMLTSENNEGRLAAIEKAGVSAICDKPFEKGGIGKEIARALRR